MEKTRRCLIEGCERKLLARAYCLMQKHNGDLTIVDFGESRESLKDKVEEIAKKYNAKILKQF